MVLLNALPLDYERPGGFAQFITFAKENTNLVFAILIFLYLVQVVYYTFFHPLRKVPGPVFARFSGAWRNIRYFRSTWHEDILELHEKYGPVVRIAPNEVSFVDPKALTALYGHGTAAKKVCVLCGYPSCGKSN